MRGNRALTSVVLCAVLGSVAPLYATIVQVHVSLEDYYAAGTKVDVTMDNFGNTDFTVGNLSGDPVWTVNEKAWWDTTNNQTIISYTVHNGSFASNVTSLHVPVPAGVTAASISAPTGWTGQQVGNELVWQTAGTGIPLFESLDTMIVRYNGLLPITFLPNAKVDLADGTLLTHSDWVISSVPEPMTLGLFVFGGLALTLSRRRH